LPLEKVGLLLEGEGVEIEVEGSDIKEGREDKEGRSFFSLFAYIFLIRATSL